MGQDGDLILDEAAVNVVGNVMRAEIERLHGLSEVAGAEAGAASPDEILTPVLPQVVDEVEVKGVASLSIMRCEGISAVVVSLHLYVRALPQVAAPMRQQIASRYGYSLVGDNLPWG